MSVSALCEVVPRFSMRHLVWEINKLSDGIYEGSIWSLLMLYQGSMKDLLRLYQGSMKDLLRLFEGYEGSIKA